MENYKDYIEKRVEIFPQQKYGSFIRYEHCIEACKMAEGKWIDNYKEKPPYGIGVLIAMRNGFITTAYRKNTAPNETTWYIYNDNLTEADVEITHWMSLPELPKTVL